MFAPPEPLHGTFVLNLSKRFADAAGRGIAAGRLGAGAVFETGLQTAAGPDTVRFPAACLFDRGVFEQMDREIIADAVPAVVIEVPGTPDRRREVGRRIEEYHAAGVREVWVADLEEMTILLAPPHTSPTVLGGDDCLTTDVLPGSPRPSPSCSPCRSGGPTACGRSLEGERGGVSPPCVLARLFDPSAPVAQTAERTRRADAHRSPTASTLAARRFRGCSRRALIRTYGGRNRARWPAAPTGARASAWFGSVRSSITKPAAHRSPINWRQPCRYSAQPASRRPAARVWGSGSGSRRFSGPSPRVYSAPSR